MIFMDEYPIDKSKEFKYKSMFVKKKQDTFTIEAKDFFDFNAELALEVYTLGVMMHNRACEEIRTLNNVSELLAQSKMKAAF
mmetsp:Transcript_47888/g.35105  ORF Transcript_47888/g.35105 Transcript_47888/m.35105 type:complete len:82 (+) Transcript_47888:250-495(+)